MRDMAETSGVRVEALLQRGMITIRCALDNPDLRGSLEEQNLALPARREILNAGARQVAWMSPDELLILCDPAEASQLVADLTAGLTETHALVAEVSDARAGFAISGPRARQCLAKLCPVDLAPGQFEPGEIRRTRMAQTPCAFWMTGPESFDLICFRSVADYAELLLRDAASAGFEGLSL